MNRAISKRLQMRLPFRGLPQNVGVNPILRTPTGKSSPAALSDPSTEQGARLARRERVNIALFVLGNEVHR
jgi:hypothetical protein